MPKRIDITGKRFGCHLVVKYRTDLEKVRGRFIYECVCDCGEVRFLNSDHLKKMKSDKCLKCVVHKNIGLKFSLLKIISYAGTQKKGRKGSSLNLVQCQCDCGTLKTLKLTHVLRGKIRSCGCLREKTNIKKAKSKIGKRSGRLKVLEFFYKKDSKHIMLLCKCDCGNKVEINTGNFGETKSCGCLQRDSVSGENSVNSRLTNKQRDLLVELRKTGMYSYRDLAKMFEVSPTNARCIFRKATTASSTPAPKLLLQSQEPQPPSLLSPESESRQLEFDWQEPCLHREAGKS
jgi:hypothetical protein